MENPEKITWVQRAKTTHRVHASNLSDDPNWKIEDTAKELNRSVGRVSEDLMLVRYMSTHPRVELFKTAQEALEYCRKIKRDQRRMIV